MKRRHYFILFITALLLAAFQTPIYTPLVQQELDERIAKYKTDQWKACQKRALEAAVLEVDSLIIQWARANRDTLDRPEKTAKPVPPEPKTPRDTTPVRPLFNGQDADTL
jgi:hypothetical protein